MQHVVFCPTSTLLYQQHILRKHMIFQLLFCQAVYGLVTPCNTENRCKAAFTQRQWW